MYQTSDKKLTKQLLFLPRFYQGSQKNVYKVNQPNLKMIMSVELFLGSTQPNLNFEP